MLRTLPAESDLLCLHPMFGPESGKDGWHGLPLVYEHVRVADHVRQRDGQREGGACDGSGTSRANQPSGMGSSW